MIVKEMLSVPRIFYAFDKTKRISILEEINFVGVNF